MKQAMLEFGRKLKEGAEASMFYYAGHGIEIAGENYLVPVDADLQSSEEADIQNVSVNSFLSLSENSGVAMNIVILDACRNNPFRSLRGAADGGLAPVKAPRGTYVAYATAPGAVANDGDAANSPFTLALTESMRQPGLTLEAVLKLTRAKVQTRTNGSQLPFDSSAITGDFYFVPVVATTAPPLVPQRDTAQDAYQAAGDDPDLLRVVVDKFGDTVWAALATEKLKRLDPAEPKILAEPKIIVAEPPAPPKAKTKPALKKAAKVYIAPPAVKPKRKIVIIEKPHIVIQSRKTVTIGLRCDSTAALRQGAICKSNDGRICRVAAVRFGKGGGKPILMGCR
jgi:Caspase domain